MDPDRRDIAGLGCSVWPGDPQRTILALHGMTSTSQVWSALAAAVPDARVVAPDLLGRGGSAGAPGGPGLAGQAAAVLRVADELGLRDVTVTGHSLGAFLAPLVAAQLQDRAARVVLLDGGARPDRSPLHAGPVVRVVFTVQMRLLNRRWRDPGAFTDAIEGRAIRNRPELRPDLLGWAGHLLAGPPGALRPRLDPRRCVSDAVDALTGPPTLPALRDSAVPVRLLAAARGAHDDAGPFLSDNALARAVAGLPRLLVERVDANHLTLLFHPAAAAALTGAI